MAYPSRYFRRHNFARDQATSQSLNNTKLDAEFNALVNSLQGVVDFVRGITNADGTLRFTTALREMDLVEETTIIATTNQTAFTVPTYNTATDRVRAFVAGVLIRPSLVVLTSTTVVTLPAQALGAVVVFEVFSAGTGVLTQLASVAANLGASLVALEDAPGNWVATNLETLATEIATVVNGLIANLGALNRYILNNGTVPMAANLAMGGFTVSGLAASTLNGQAVRHEQLQAVITTLTGTTSTFLAKAGGTMSGAINMAGQRITNVPTAAAGTDVVSKNEVTSMLSSFGGLPVGTIIAYGGAAAPTGWLLCDGSAYDRTSATYLNLFSVIGTTYGVGAGGNDFQVPDLRGRAAVGAGLGTGLTVRTRGQIGGTETHTLTIAEMPAHTHVLNCQGGSSGGTPQIDGGAAVIPVTTLPTGGGGAHNNMQPFTIANMLVKI